MLDARGTRLNAVLEFKVSEDLLRDRLKDRGRADDTEDAILNRMKVYRDETAPLLDYYNAISTPWTRWAPSTRRSPAR
jgi:adenylate kinase